MTGTFGGLTKPSLPNTPREKLGQFASSQRNSWKLGVLDPDIFIIFPITEMVLNDIGWQEKALRPPRETH